MYVKESKRFFFFYCTRNSSIKIFKYSKLFFNKTEIIHKYRKRGISGIKLLNYSIPLFCTNKSKRVESHVNLCIIERISY